MSYRIGDEEVFETASSVSGGAESDDDGEEGGDHFPGGGGGGGAAGAEEGSCDDLQDHRAFAPQPLRRMNSDSIYDMTSMMSQLPAKKGLSRYYEGKSQSFACMSEVRVLEDLRKGQPLQAEEDQAVQELRRAGRDDEEARRLQLLRQPGPRRRQRLQDTLDSERVPPVDSAGEERAVERALCNNSSRNAFLFLEGH